MRVPPCDDVMSGPRCILVVAASLPARLLLWRRRGIQRLVVCVPSPWIGRPPEVPEGGVCETFHVIESFNRLELRRRTCCPAIGAIPAVFQGRVVVLAAFVSAQEVAFRTHRARYVGRGTAR
jgi:hypothetical protein